MQTYDSGNGQRRYNGIWNPSTTAQYIALGKNENNFLADYNTQYAAGLKLYSIATNLINGQVLYSGVWRPKAAGQYFRIAKTRADFDAFAGRIVEGMTAAGIQPQGPPDIKEFPVHEMIHA